MTGEMRVRNPETGQWIEIAGGAGGGIVDETDPTVPAWAKQPNKPTYTADEVGALSQDALTDAVDDALAQAKASGEFDGAQGPQGEKGADGATAAEVIAALDRETWVFTLTDGSKIEKVVPLI